MKNNLKIILYIIFAVFIGYFLAGCSCLSGFTILENQDFEDYQPPTMLFNLESGIEYDWNLLVTPEELKDLCENQFNRIVFKIRKETSRWQGIPYQYGEMSKNGVDCSGFVVHVFKKFFGIQLERDTSNQAITGKQIPKNELRAGDLVFFKNGFGKHVGIYLENNAFVHTSYKKGVTISDLSEPYWTKYYLTSRRILPDCNYL